MKTEIALASLRENSKDGVFIVQTEEGKKEIASAHKEAMRFFSKKFEIVVSGWKEAETVTELDTILEKVVSFYHNITFGELNQFFNGLNLLKTLTNSYLIDFQKKLIKNNIFQETTIKEFLDIYSMNIENSDICDIYEKLVSGIFLGEIFFSWFRNAIDTRDVKLQTKASYIGLKVKNPFLVIPDEVSEITGSFYDKQDKVIINLEDENQVFNRFSRFLIEMGLSIDSIDTNELNAWGYCDKTSLACLRIMNRHDETSAKLIADIFSFCQTKEVVFPPQFFWIFEYIRSLFPDLEIEVREQYSKISEQEKSVKVYEACVEKFYQKNPSGLLDYFEGKLNYSVAGLNRVFENPRIISAVQETKKDMVSVSVFCGPRGQAEEKAIAHNAIKVITVDELEADILDKRSLFVANELIPLQKTDQILSNTISGADNGISSEHISANLPDQWSKVGAAMRIEDSVSTAFHLMDERGSGLYLSKEDLLIHLESIFTFIKDYPDSIISFSNGIFHYLNVDLHFKVIDSGLEIIDEFSFLRNGSYDKKSRSIVDLFLYKYSILGDPGTMFCLKNVLKDILYYSSITTSLESFSAALGFHIGLKQTDLIFSIDSEIYSYAKEYLEILKSNGDLAAQDFISKTINRLSTAEGKFLREDLREMFNIMLSFNLESFYNFVTEVAGKLSITTSRQGVINLSRAVNGLNSIVEVV